MGLKCTKRSAGMQSLTDILVKAGFEVETIGRGVGTVAFIFAASR